MRLGAGIWLFGQFVDRYATDAYGPPVSTLEAIREDPVEAARTSVETTKLIDGALDRLDHGALADAQRRQDAVAAQRLVLDLLLAR
jgi:hypothetical protein